MQLFQQNKYCNDFLLAFSPNRDTIPAGSFYSTACLSWNGDSQTKTPALYLLCSIFFKVRETNLVPRLYLLKVNSPVLYIGYIQYDCSFKYSTISVLLSRVVDSLTSMLLKFLCTFINFAYCLTYYTVIENNLSINMKNMKELTRVVSLFHYIKK